MKLDMEEGKRLLSAKDLERSRLPRRDLVVSEATDRASMRKVENQLKEKARSKRTKEK
jgi:hypothetical protein